MLLIIRHICSVKPSAHPKEFPIVKEEIYTARPCQTFTYVRDLLFKCA